MEGGGEVEGVSKVRGGSWNGRCYYVLCSTGLWNAPAGAAKAHNILIDRIFTTQIPVIWHLQIEFCWILIYHVLAICHQNVSRNCIHRRVYLKLSILWNIYLRSLHWICELLCNRVDAKLTTISLSYFSNSQSLWNVNSIKSVAGVKPWPWLQNWEWLKFAPPFYHWHTKKPLESRI